MEIMNFVLFVIFFLATVVAIYSLLYALVELSKGNRKPQRKTRKFSADSMNKCAESAIDLAKSQYSIIYKKIIDDITLSIKERAKEGVKFDYFGIQLMADRYLRKESHWLSSIQRLKLSRDFKDKYFCVIQKHFENRGFVVSKIVDGYEYTKDMEISWE